MPRLSAVALKERIALLQKQLAAAETRKQPAINKVKALMKKLGVTVADLGGGGTGKRRGRPPKAAGKGRAKKAGRKGSRGAVPIKYRDDKGNTWTGRGKTPRWIAAAEKAGTKRESFLVK